MREIRTSGSMSGDGKRGDTFVSTRAHPRLYQEIQESRIMVPARATAAVSSTWVEYCLAWTAELG
jgi:hypothetical protein